MTEEENNLKGILQNLKANVMFRVSLCSKEEFHSNFIAYLLEKYPKVVKIFGENKEATNVKREAKHTDISFECNEQLIIIENKIKSIPGQDQLKKYIDEAEKNNEHIEKLILLSYFTPQFNLTKYNDTQIKYLSYNELAGNLEKIKNEIHQEDEQYFEDYLKMLSEFENLKSCLKLKGKKIQYKELRNIIDGAKEDAEEFNFYSTLQKIFLNELACDLLQEEDIKNYDIVPFVGYSYGKAYLDLVIHKNDEYFGISLLLNINNKIRILYGKRKKETENEIQINTENMKKHFLFNENRNLCFEKSGRTQDGFGHFKGKDGTQIYKNVKTTDSSQYNLLDMDYNKIKVLVNSEFEYITKNLE